MKLPNQPYTGIHAVVTKEIDVSGGNLTMIFENKNRRSPRIALFVFAVLAILGVTLAPAQPAEAALGFGYRFSMEWNFDSGIDGVLEVEAGKGEVGNLTEVLARNRYPIKCRRIGPVALAGGNVELNGGYLSCDLHVARAINHTMAACRAIEPDCEYNLSPVERYRGLTMYAKVPATVPGKAPIFHHPDASFTLNAGTGTATMENEINPVPGTISSDVFGLGNPLIGAQYFCVAGLACDMQYYAAGGPLSVAGPFANAFQMSTGKTTFYIGHNPSTGAAAPAGTQYDHIFIDPSASGDHYPFTRVGQSNNEKRLGHRDAPASFRCSLMHLPAFLRHQTPNFYATIGLSWMGQRDGKSLKEGKNEIAEIDEPCTRVIHTSDGVHPSIGGCPAVDC